MAAIARSDFKRLLVGGYGADLTFVPNAVRGSVKLASEESPVEKDKMRLAQVATAKHGFEVWRKTEVETPDRFKTVC